jgi:hypothetical protein
MPGLRSGILFLLIVGTQWVVPLLKANIIPISNAGFEASTEFTESCPGGSAVCVCPGTSPTQYFNLNYIPDWTVSGTWVGDYRPTVEPPVRFISPYAGLNVAYVASGTLSQVLTDVVGPDLIYTLAVAVGRRYEVQDPQSFTIQLLAGQTAIIDYTGDTSGIALGGWQLITLQGSSGNLSSIPLQVVLSGGNGALDYSAGQIVFDNVRLTDNVPEPFTLGLFGSGIGVIALFRLLRRKRQ